MQSLFLSENATEADKSIMRKLCTVGQSPTFVTATTYVFFLFFFCFHDIYVNLCRFEESMRKSYAETLREKVDDTSASLGSFRVSTVSTVSSSSTNEVSIHTLKNMTLIAGAAAALVLYVCNFSKKPKFPLMDAVRALNKWLGPYQKDPSFGVSKMIASLRDIAAKTGVQDVVPAQFNNLLMLAGVMNSMSPDTRDIEKMLNGLLGDSKIAAANNAPKVARLANKARNKMQARAGKTLSRAEELMRDIQQPLMTGFPYKGFSLVLSSELVNQFDKMKQEDSPENIQSCTAAILNPACIDIVGGETREIQSIAEHRPGFATFIHIPSDPQLSANLMELLPFVYTRGVISSTNAPLALASVVFNETLDTAESVWRAMAVITGLKNYLNLKKKQNPFNFDESVEAYVYGSTTQEIPNVKMALLAPLLSSTAPFPLLLMTNTQEDVDIIPKSILVQCLMPVLQQALPKQKALNSQDVLSSLMQMQWDKSPQDILQLLLDGNTTRGVTASNLVKVDTLCKDIVLETLALLSDHPPGLDGIACPLLNGDQISKILVFQAAVFKCLSIDATAKMVQDTSFTSLFRHSQNFREAFLEAAWRLCLVNALAGHKVSSVEAADMMKQMKIYSSTGSFYFCLPNVPSQMFAKMFVEQKIKTAVFPKNLVELALLSREVDVQEHIEALLKNNTDHMDQVEFRVVQQLVSTLNTSTLRQSLFQRLKLSTVVPSIAKSWPSCVMEDFILSELDMSHVGVMHVFFLACFSLTDPLKDSMKVAVSTLNTFSAQQIVEMVMEISPEVKKYAVFEADDGLLFDIGMYINLMDSVDEMCHILSYMIMYPYFMDFLSSMEILLTSDSPSKYQKKLAETLRMYPMQITETVRHLLNTTYMDITVTDEVRSTAINWAKTIQERNNLFSDTFLSKDDILDFCKDRMTQGHSWFRLRVDDIGDTFEKFVSVRMAMEEDELYGPKLRIHNLAMRVLPQCTFEFDSEGKKKKWMVPEAFHDDIKKTTLPVV